jgi:hypothetical protein
MKFQLTMAKQIRGLGGGRGPTTAAIPTNNIRGNNNNNNNFVLLPSGVLPNNTAQDDLLLTPTTEDLLLLQPENLWLDLASDMSTFIELDSIPEVTETTAGGGSLLLPDLVRGLGLKEDDPEELELMQAANMKILDEYRCFMQGDDISFDDDGADDSMDSFAASDLDSNQSLIEEVETYLQGVSGGIATTAILMAEEPPKAVVEEVETKAVIPAVVSRQETVIRKQQQQQLGKLSAEDNSRILKAMVEGKVLAPPANNSFEDSFASSSCDGSFDLTEEDLVNAYTTTIKTENGQDVIIIIAQPGSPASRYVPDMVAAASPSLGSPAYSCSDDYEWSPSPQQKQSAQRKKYQRKNRPTPIAEPYPRYHICFYYRCCGA